MAQRQLIPVNPITGAPIPGRTGVSLLARIRMANGALLTQASLTTLAYTVSDLTNGTALGASTFTIASVVFDSLQQNDPRWQVDSATEPGSDGSHGFNFLAVLPATLFALTVLAEPGVLTGFAPGVQVQADVTFTPVSGQPWRISWRWRATPVYG